VSHITMCRPAFFNVTRRSLTNRMMNPDNPPGKDLASNQWWALRESFRRHGVVVYIMESQPGLEDMTFVANAGLPVRGHFVLSNFLEEERRGEKEHNRNYFGRIYGSSRILSLSDEAIFEGQGDALFLDKNTLLIGYGVRTNERAVEEISSMIYGLDANIVVVPLRFNSLDHYLPHENIFYHLDTCLLSLRSANRVIIHSDTFSSEAIRTLEKLGRNVVSITKEDADLFVCNSVVFDDMVFTPKIGRCRVRNLLTSIGYTVEENDMSEFLKSGGAVKCLSLEMNG